MDFDLKKNSKILVTGSTGFLGRHVVRSLKNSDFTNLVCVNKSDYDLRKQAQVCRLFEEHQPEFVVNLAGVVGGIMANKKRPAQFCYDNLTMGTLVLQEAYQSGVKKYLTCICGCSYPGDAPSPIKEEYLWDGYPHPASAPYSVAKKMSVVQAQAYRRQYDFDSVILVPGNMYGPHDNFHPEDSHVIPALIRRVYEAKKDGKGSITVWGSGKPIRDFVFVGDVAEALVVALKDYNGDEIINISSGEGISIRELVNQIVEVARYNGDIVWDRSKPDGQVHKVFSVKKMKKVLDFEPKTSLKEGLMITYNWFSKHYQSARL